MSGIAKHGPPSNQRGRKQRLLRKCQKERSTSNGTATKPKENLGYSVGINAATETINNLKSAIGGVGNAMIENQDKFNTLAAASATHAASIKFINDKLDRLTRTPADTTNKLNSESTRQQKPSLAPTAGGDDGQQNQGKRKTATKRNSRG